MIENFVSSSLEKIEEVVKKPEKFISSPTDLIIRIQTLLKDNYDFTKTEEKNNTSNTLPELIVKNFDLEQIWQQIELQNNEILAHYVNTVSRLVAFKDKLAQKDKSATDDVIGNEPSENEYMEENIENTHSEKEDTSESSDEDEGIDFDTLEDETQSSDIMEPEEKQMFDKKVKSSIVDDEFFKLREMEEFLMNEEKEKKQKIKNYSEDEESVDLFNEDENNFDDGDEFNFKKCNPRYKDFFGTPRDNILKTHIEQEDNENEKHYEIKKDKDCDSEDEDGDSEDQVVEQKSSLELREERLKKKIENIEEFALQEKPWQLKGEITADKRPENSLLQEIVEFDMTSRPAPIITQETTFILEDVIKQRIKDKAWDSVERKLKIIEAPTEFKKKLVLDQEKSKQSLAQIYENEYIKQKELLDPEAGEKPAEERKEHIEIKSLMKSLFMKLDALSNFHFTPKIVMPELRVVNNMPAITMEEVAPVAASDAALLAPEEIKSKPKGDVIGQSERTKTDKKRERRKKKRKQHVHSLEKQKKEKINEKNPPGSKQSKIKTSKLINTITKDRNVNKMDESLGSKSTKSSTAFFTQLQDEVKGYIKRKANPKSQNKENPYHIAKKLKL